MAYSDDIIALNPDHVWSFDGNLLDSVGSLNATGTSIASGSPLTEDALNSSVTNATGDRAVLATAATVDQQLDRKALGGWIRITAIQPPPKSLYREGTTGNQFCFVCWAGNNLMLDIVNNGSVKQLFAQQILEPNRPYHILGKFSGTGFSDSIEFYVDGVLQGSITADEANLLARTVGEWGDPSGSTEVGNETVLLNAPVNGEYQYWASWSGTNAENLTETDVREELFEKGAVPGVTISSDTEVNMQTALDALADTLRPDEPLNIRIADVTGGGVLNLSADNITHDPKASIHIQFIGTGTLNYTNTNGANASIGSTPNGGVLNFINPAVLTVSPLVVNSEVRVLENGTTNEVAGIENSGTSFQSSISVNTVDIVVANNDYEFIRIDGVDMTQGDVTVPISQILDRQYENP